MQIIKTVLDSPWFADQPPVLIDIGASGEINAKWKKIAAWSICIAFDADDREFHVNENIASGYKKLLVINRIVTASKFESTGFYLTASPFCSSLLEPDIEKLRPWIFHSLFRVKQKVMLQSVTLGEALQEAGIKYIDWFKSDTQGTDLRLFLSVSNEVRENILAAEFEPGIIDAYKGEDKLFSLMEKMHQSGFWLSTMDVKGTQRLNERYQPELGEFNATRIIRKSPCWAELSYLRNPSLQDQRKLLLLYVFALLERQYGFALEVCDVALEKFDDPIFTTCRKAVLQKLKKEKLKVPLVMLKKQFNKLFANINA